MGDLRQVVRWAIERKCPLRAGDQWFQIETTFKQLGSLRSVAFAESERCTFRGICVTNGNTNPARYTGFRIDDRLAPLGGFETARGVCRGCEANLSSDFASALAGCIGYFDVWPDCEKLDRRLWSIIHELDLEDSYRAAFPVTTPLWYGFWFNSPLKQPQADILHELLYRAFDPEHSWYSEIQHFIGALKTAVRWDLAIQVSISPPGHAEDECFIFPHCPRCKAEALGCGHGGYPDYSHKCKVCGHLFNAAEHTSHESLNDDWDAGSLKRLLGDVDYEEFTRAFVRYHFGFPEMKLDLADFTDADSS